jgi:putative component of membrane protein insertase Oxa1/YidC/SpoIIIJ protein YidD
MALANTVAVTGIKAYQRWISPHKGFHCAHQELHRAGTCSHFGRMAFAQYPIRQAWELLHNRLKECRAAHLTILAQAEREEEDNRKRGFFERSIRDGYCCELIGCADVGSAACELAACW